VLLLAFRKFVVPEGIGVKAVVMVDPVFLDGDNGFGEHISLGLENLGDFWMVGLELFQDTIF